MMTNNLLFDMTRSTPKRSSLSFKQFFCVLGFAFACSSSLAQTASRAPTLTLEASARTEVTNDEMVIRLAVEREGTDLNSINQFVLQSLNSGIEQAKKVSDVKATLGSLYTNQNWTPQGRPSGWKVRGEIVLQSKNLAGLGQLAGDLSARMLLAGVQFRLSAEARAQAEKRLLVEAANAFRNRAKEASLALGFKDFAMKDLNLSNGFNVIVRPLLARAEMAMAKTASAAVPTESGESEVVLSFSGSIELK